MSDLADLLKAPGASIEAEEDFEAINALYLERGWSDGLPIVPPTAARVEKMLEYCDRPFNEPIGRSTSRSRKWRRAMVRRPRCGSRRTR
jgi:hypothetical protein